MGLFACHSIPRHRNINYGNSTCVSKALSHGARQRSFPSFCKQGFWAAVQLLHSCKQFTKFSCDSIRPARVYAVRAAFQTSFVSVFFGVLFSYHRLPVVMPLLYQKARRATELEVAVYWLRLTTMLEVGTDPNCWYVFLKSPWILWSGSCRSLPAHVPNCSCIGS